MTADQQRIGEIRLHVLLSTFSNYGSKIFSLATGFLLTPFILSRIGASDFGLFVLVQSVVGYASLLDFGIQSAIVKYVSEYQATGRWNEAHEMVATALGLYSILGALVITSSIPLALLFPHIFHLARHHDPTVLWLVLFIGLFTGISIPCAATTGVLLGLQRFDLANLMGTAATLISTIVTIILLLLGAGVVGMAVVGTPVKLIMQIPILWSIRRIAPELRVSFRSFRRSLVGKIVRYSSSLFAIQIGTRLQQQTDAIVIGAMLPVREVTSYSLAQRLSTVSQGLAIQFTSVLLPLASQLDALNDQGRVRALFLVSTRVTLGILVPLSTIVIILARPILTLWVGATYAQYDYLVDLITAATLIAAAQWPAGGILQGIARHHLFAFTALGAGLLNLLLSIALAPRYGLAGVAIGTLIPTALEGSCFVVPYAMRLVHVGPLEIVREALTPAVVPVLPMAGAMYLALRWWEPLNLLMLIVIMGIGTLVYFAVYLRMGAAKVEREAFLDVIQHSKELLLRGKR